MKEPNRRAVLAQISENRTVGTPLSRSRRRGIQFDTQAHAKKAPQTDGGKVLFLSDPAGTAIPDDLTGALGAPRLQSAAGPGAGCRRKYQPGKRRTAARAGRYRSGREETRFQEQGKGASRGSESS